MMFPTDQGFPGGLVEGYYLYRRDHAQRVPIPIRIWFGPPADPLTGEPMDRSPRWHFEIGGKLYGSDDPPMLGGRAVDEDGLDRMWPKSSRWPSDAEEYAYLVSRREWARENDEDDPHGGDIKVCPLTAPLD